MKTYRVSCGDMKRVKVSAKSFDEAAIKAIKRRNPKGLGMIMEVIEGEGEAFYMDTERILRKMGKWSDK